jgi:hypothetical protein
MPRIVPGIEMSQQPHRAGVVLSDDPRFGEEADDSAVPPAYGAFTRRGDDDPKWK